jgi:hypothetical protein
MKYLNSLVFGILIIVLNISSIWANDTGFIIQAQRINSGEKIKIDGILDEAVWGRVQPFSNFRQQIPVEGADPTERTEIYVVFDDQYLYIAAKLFDSDPSGIKAFQKRRNQGLGPDDRFMWILDTFNDGRNAYFFELNPAGLMGDGLLTVGQGTNINKSWDGIWDAKVAVTSEGWFVEVRIPFRTLDFNPDNSVWGINFQRTVRRKNEEIVWSGWRQNQGIFRPQNAGKLYGLSGISQGIGLEVKPYISGNQSRIWPIAAESQENYNSDVGFDMTYSITPGLRASMSVNTDFAEAEVDERRVNLTRFPLVFPEQRDFFLEGSSVFSFAPGSNINPFFSRRIGLVDNSPVPILFGTRAIGRAANTNLGFYQIRTGESDINKEDFTIARVSQNIFKESRVGLLYTRRNTIGDDSLPVRHTVGADFELETSRFMGNKNLQFSAFFVTHNENTLDEDTNYFDRSVRGMRISYPNFPFYWRASYREFGNSFNPAVGIAPRVGFRRLQPSAGYIKLYNNSRIIRSLETNVFVEYLMDLDFKPETALVRWEPMELTFESGEEIAFSFGHGFERLDRPFDIRRDGNFIVPAGDYYYWTFQGEFSSATFRKLSGRASYNYEGFWTGTRNQTNLSGTARLYPGINLTGEWSHVEVSLAEGDFITDLYRLRSNIDLTPMISFTSILQYDNMSELMGLYQRFRWIFKPGADLYLVYSWNWINLENHFTPIENSSAVKVSYTYRF